MNTLLGRAATAAASLALSCAPPLKSAQSANAEEPSPEIAHPKLHLTFKPLGPRLIAGQEVWFELEIRNQSDSEFLLSFHGVRSWRFSRSTRSSDHFRGGSGDISVHDDMRRIIRHCPDDHDVYALKPQMSLFKLARVKLPEDMHGQLKVEPAVEVLRLPRSLGCEKGQALRLEGSALMPVVEP